MTRNIEVGVHNDRLRVWVDGRPVQPGSKVTLTAEELAVMVREHAWAGVAAGRKAGSKETAAMALQAGAAAVKATANAAAQAGAQAAAQPAFDAGARYAAQAIAKSTRIRRTVERGPDGQITGTVESREPNPTKGKT